MTRVEEFLKQNNILYTWEGGVIVIVCPSCGEEAPEYHINPNAESGECQNRNCDKKTANLEELAGALGYPLRNIEEGAKKKDNSSSSETTPHEPIAIIPWSSFDKLEFPEERWVVNRLVPLGSVVIIAAPSGEKKSWFALEMARSIVLGADFLDNPDFKTIKSKVLYIDQETPHREIHRRGRQLGINEIQEGIWLPYRQGQPPLNLNDKVTLNDLYGLVEANEIGVIFLDTFRSVAGGLEEDRGERIRGFLQKFNPWKDSGKTIVILDHFRKPRDFDSQTPRKEQLIGSQDKLAAVETLIMMRSKERSEEIMVFPMKNKSGIPIDPFRALIRDSDSGNDIKTTLRFDGHIEGVGLKVEEMEEWVISVLADKPDKKWGFKELEAIRPDSIGGKSALEQAVKNLREGKKIEFERLKNKYLYWALEEE